jgi:L-malate glycosyltransferase
MSAPSAGEGARPRAASPPSVPSPVARVGIVQQAVFHYRQRFFELLRERLAADGVELVLVHSNDPTAEDVWESVVELPWSHRVPLRRLRVGRRELLWQPCWNLLRGCDLVIVEQGSRHLLNYLLLAQQLVGRRNVALWGHGRNFKVHEASRLGEALKARWSHRVHWWFAYNARTAEIVAGLGFPEQRITVLDNAIDTRELREQVAAVARSDLERTRREVGLGGDNVGLYMGGWAAAKGLDDLFTASDVVRAEVEDFELVVAGAGPEEAKVQGFAATRPWVHVVGTLRGEDKARLLAAAQLLLVPAAAGLVVLDSFAAGVPIVVAAGRGHGPEVAYLEHGINGWVVQDGDDPVRYGRAVAALLKDDARRAALRDGCLRSAELYTVEGMVDRFAAGIASARASVMRGG